MPTLAELLVSGTQEAGQKNTPDLLEGASKGIELASHIQNMQAQRQKLEQQKAEALQAKFAKVGDWIETAAKMPDGQAKKAFVNNYIPNGIAALGLNDKIDPTVLKMLSADPNFGTFLVSEIQKGNTDTGILASPDGMAKLMASPAYAQFGGLQSLQSAVEEYRPKLEEAQAKKAAEDSSRENAKIVATGRGDERKINNIEDLRKEVTAHPITKTTIQMDESYGKIRSAFGGKPSPAGDISGVFAYMKMLDQGSTVREGEQAQARNAAGVPDQIRNLYNKLLTGESLNPTQRRDFTNQAGKLYRDQYGRQQSLNKDFEAIAKSTGINPKLIFAGTRFKAPPPEAKEFSPSAAQKDAWAKSSEDEKQIIIERLTKDGHDAKTIRAKLGGQ